MFDFLTQKFSSIFSSFHKNSKLTQDNIAQTLEQIQESLLEADVPLATVQEFIATVQKEVLGQKLVASMKPAEQFIKIVYDRMVAFLGGAYLQETFTFQIPSVVLMMGLQGSGKTTTISKLAYFIKNQAEKRGKSRNQNSS